MLKVIIPIDSIKIKKQIAALEYQIARDTRAKDKQIHIEALQLLKESITK